MTHQHEMPRVRFATAKDGVRVAYAVAGQGEPLIYVPGWISHLEKDWHLLANELFADLAQRRQLILFDHRGCGLSDRNVTDVSLPNRVLDIEAIVTHLGLERFAIFGWSHGAPPAIVYAAEHPDKVSQMVLYAPFCEGFGWKNEGVCRAMIQLIRAEWEQERSWRLGARTVSAFTDPEADRSQEEESLRYFREAAGGDIAASLLEEGMFETDVRHYLADITAPTLVLHRRHDNAVPMESGRRVASLLPNARFMPLEGSIHVPFRGATGPLVHAMWEFLCGETLPHPHPAEAPEAAHTHEGMPVTILFTDMEGSTTLTQRLGDERAQELVRSHNAIVREALSSNDGHEIKHTGDGIMASFPSASRAIECAVAVQTAIARHNEEHADAQIQVRIGLNAGEPIEEESDLFGTVVQAARRISDRAQPGQILVSDVVRQLAAGKPFPFADRGRILLKGFRERIRLYEVSWRP